MKLDPYEVTVPEGKESEGYVYLRHDSQYTLLLRNLASTHCDAEVWMDGREVGDWRVPALKTVVLRRPVHDTGRFTFYEVGSQEAEARNAGISESDQLGLLTVIFKPEKAGVIRGAPPSPREGYDKIMAGWLVNLIGVSPSPSQGYAGGTGLSGQEFSEAAPIEYDLSQAVTIHLRLVGDPDEPRPMFQRETAVPPPVAPRGGKPPSNNPTNAHHDDAPVKTTPGQMQETKRRIRHEIRDEVSAERVAKKRPQSDRLKRWQYLVILLILILGMSFVSASLGYSQTPGPFLTILGMVQIPLLWMRLTDAGLKGWIALLALIPLVGMIVGIMGLILPTKDD